MNKSAGSWDYLIVTASNEAQARFYQTQLDLRQKLGLITGVRRILVAPDPRGLRIGSGGSTILSLLKVLDREARAFRWEELSRDRIEGILSGLRILIIHAGGDSRRLPPYSSCGKIFIPVPGKLDSPLGNTIFDRQFLIYKKLPLARKGRGQVVVTTGDVLLFFSPEDVKFREKGLTGLGCSISPEKAKNHGVFCPDRKRDVRLFLQKPSVSEQRKKGAVDSQGQSMLDIGVMEMDPSTAAKLITLVNITAEEGALRWAGPIAEDMTSGGMDFYRDICCAIGKEICFDDFVKNVRASGSALSESTLLTIFDSLNDAEFSVHPLEKCVFLHFGTPGQLIETGSRLLHMEQDDEYSEALLNINNHILQNTPINGTKSWVEGCRIGSELTLGGENVVVGADVDRPLSLSAKTCLDIIKGHNREGKNIWFVRIYNIEDCFKASIDTEAKSTNQPLTEWLKKLGGDQKDIWDTKLPDSKKNLWNAKIFPAVSSMNDYHEWLWMATPSQAETDQVTAWLEADRYSLEEMADLVDLDDFERRRRKNRAEEIRDSLAKIFRQKSGFSAEDLAFIFAVLDNEDRAAWIGGILEEAFDHIDTEKKGTGTDRLLFSRAAHTLGTAVKNALESDKKGWDKTIRCVREDMTVRDKNLSISVGLDTNAFQNAETWCGKLQEVAFENLSRTIVRSKKKPRSYPRCTVRPDAIIWGRAPARLDLAGGWTDTPPYALEYGGCVINAAANLNGQPPIHVYARLTEDPVIRITSIDHGMRIVIEDLPDLMDYRKATSEFSLAKAALVLSGFSPLDWAWPSGTKTLENMLEHFGGGIELTTLAAIPSGSGLGTSSIMGAVLLSVIDRMIGRETNQRELFNRVLQLEQELTTGGGWQDQIGGTLGGVKIISTEPGLVPDPKIQAVKTALLDPRLNRGQTLLYYTGMRRLAKNILRHIVGRYLDRNRRTMETLHKLHAFPPLLADALEREDMQRFGKLIDRAFHLKKEIDPDASNPTMEKILEKFRPHMIGATFLGAGGGGFLLVVAKSPEDAEEARKVLGKDPPNPLARFFAYDISSAGLEVTVS